MRTVVLWVVVLLVPARAVAEPIYERAKRVAYIAGALRALETVDTEVLANAHNYFYAMERNKCRSSSASLRVSCMLEAAKQSCRQGAAQAQQDCQRIADIIIANRLSEKRFISARRRYEIMKDHHNYKAELLKELRRRYAALATELGMSRLAKRAHDDDLAAAIDGYCLDASSARDLSWQTCVAALVWFIGTSPPPSGDQAPPSSPP